MAKILVGCKLPNGLCMELTEPGNMIMPAPTGKRVWLKGANSVQSGIINTATPQYGLTYVDQEFAEAWFLKNEKASFVTSGVVFKAENEKVFAGEVKDRRETKTGLEPYLPLLDEKGGENQPGVVVADKKAYERAVGMSQSGATV